ncbi:hypothetical protein [Escherichia coli]|uniref:hypothetical protein n=1 Tax=Escherichia coli TaxID=562 RepID=UPI0027DF7B64|nr:hypothetical protein [Escherichia coli]
MEMINLKKFDTITINDVSMVNFLDIIHNNFNRKDGLKIIVTPNIDHLQRLRNSDDPSFCKAYEISDYRLCDSRIVQKLSSFNEQNILNVVPGSDLTRELLRLDWVRRAKVTIIGTTEKQVEQLKKIFNYTILNILILQWDLRKEIMKLKLVLILLLTVILTLCSWL